MNLENIGRGLDRCHVVIILLAAWLFILSGGARSQTSSMASRITIQGPAGKSSLPIIRDALNRPCLDVQAMARAHVVNPQIIDHVVSIKNNCHMVIKVKVCYLGAENCKLVEVQAYKRVDTALGSMNGSRFFQYIIRQQ